MTPDPDARSVVMRSALRATSPSPGAYEVVKISTTAAPTLRAVASSDVLRSAAVVEARGGVCPSAAGALRIRLTNAAAKRTPFRLGFDISVVPLLTATVTDRRDCETRAVRETHVTWLPSLSRAESWSRD